MKNEDNNCRMVFGSRSMSILFGIDGFETEMDSKDFLVIAGQLVATDVKDLLEKVKVSAGSAQLKVYDETYSKGELLFLSSSLGAEKWKISDIQEVKLPRGIVKQLRQLLTELS